MKIIVVEDEKAFADIVKKKLEVEGFEVEVAPDGEAALPAVFNFHPDLVILDLILPKKNGLEVLKELKSGPELKKIPVVVLSVVEDKATIEKAMALGAEDYFVKTEYSLQEFVSRMKSRFVEAEQ